MRIIAGSARSVRLVAPKDARVRPTSDAVRESLFSTLGAQVTEGPFLDLYAGSGAVGLEALSRGAPACVFVERHRRCVEAIRLNLANTGLAEGATIIAGDAARVGARAVGDHGPFAVVFVDPPYDDGQAPAVAAGLLTEEALLPGGLLVLQHSRRTDPVGLPPADRVKHFGETALSFFSRGPKES